MKNIALCCRGGGTKSVSSVGVIKALTEMGFKISRISGTSIASIIGALYATGTSPDDILEFLKEHVEVYSKTARILGGDGNFEIIETSVDISVGFKTFSECNIPLTICASNGNFLFSKPIVFSTEDFPDLSLGKACWASCSFPFLYQKYHLKYNGKTYKCLDGGLTLNPIIVSSEDEVSILSSFYKRADLKENTASLYANAWQQAENAADMIIKPVVPLGTLGTPEDCQQAFDIGYQETTKVYSKIKSLVLSD